MAARCFGGLRHEGWPRSWHGSWTIIAANRERFHSRSLAMTYTLEQFSDDCRAALMKDPGPAGRELVRQYTAKASADPDFVAKYLGPGANAERNILYQDPDLHFCIIAHIYHGAKNSS